MHLLEIVTFFFKGTFSPTPNYKQWDSWDSCGNSTDGTKTKTHKKGDFTFSPTTAKKVVGSIPTQGLGSGSWCGFWDNKNYDTAKLQGKVKLLTASCLNRCDCSSPGAFACPSVGITSKGPFYLGSQKLESAPNKPDKKPVHPKRTWMNCCWPLCTTKCYVTSFCCSCRALTIHSCRF